MFEDSPELREALATTNEGKRGAESLARMAAALGYKDPLHFGQIDHKCSYGDFLEFLEDNGGCIEAIKNWVQNNTIDTEDSDIADAYDELDSQFNEEYSPLSDNPDYLEGQP